jgi:hypothetical protein
VATYGEAIIGNATVGELMDLFNAEKSGEAAEYPAELGGWFSGRLTDAMQPRRGDFINAEDMGWPLGFVVAVFDSSVGRLYEVRVRAGDYEVEALALSTDNPGVYPFGSTDGIDRLINGVDTRAMRRAGFTISEEDEDKLDLVSYDLIVPEQMDEAVEMAESLLGVQLLAQRFSWGPYVNKEARVQVCGGVIRTVALTEEGGRWVRGEPSNSLARTAQARLPGVEAPQHGRRSA